MLSTTILTAFACGSTVCTGEAAASRQRHPSLPTSSPYADSHARETGESKAPELLTTVQCDRTSEPGRVRCGVEAKPRAGATLTWADVVVVDVPSFATALRGRVGPDEATAKEPVGYRFALALVAKSTGKGTLHLRVRAVLCTEADGCHSVTSEASTEVVVGSG